MLLTMWMTEGGSFRVLHSGVMSGQLQRTEDTHKHATVNAQPADLQYFCLMHSFLLGPCNDSTGQHRAFRDFYKVLLSAAGTAPEI